VGACFHGVYEDRTFINNGTINNNHYSFNSEGGVHAVPTAGERAAMREQHIGRTQEQFSHQQAARVDRSNYASVNHGTPAHLEGMGVNARQDRQQNRINQGVHSGQLTPGETSRIEKNETGIHNEARNDHAMIVRRMADISRLESTTRSSISRIGRAARFTATSTTPKPMRTREG